MSAGWQFRSALAAAAGGVLWMAYGVFEMLRPWGEAVVYRDDRGYEVVTDPILFFLYNLPGSVALMLTALALIGMLKTGPVGETVGKYRIVATYVVVGIGILGAISIAFMFVPIFFAGIVFGPFILGVVSVSTGVIGRRVSGRTLETTLFLIVGSLGMLMVPLRPLVYAMELVPEAMGAAIIGLYGMGWMGLAYLSWTGRTSSSSLERYC